MVVRFKELTSEIAQQEFAGAFATFNEKDPTMANDKEAKPSSADPGPTAPTGGAKPAKVSRMVAEATAGTLPARVAGSSAARPQTEGRQGVNRLR